MATLKTLGDRLPTLRGKLDNAAGPRRVLPRPSLRWKKTARWRALREIVIARDGMVCAQTGVALIDGRSDPNALVVDHIVPHRDDPALFWDPGNLQVVCKSWHDSEKQKADQAYSIWVGPAEGGGGQ